MIKNNEYFDGKVKSIGYEIDGQKATVGVMAPGSYEFGTDAPERMTVIQGTLSVLLRGKSEYTDFKAGDSFEVEGNSTFSLIVEQNTSYLCQFL